ncbi:MAG TPA: hypothetical protein VIV40_31790 [Kofleriaceae bacterium]
MAKKQTRRSISVSRTTYERLKAFCESNNISMSQFVETRVGDFLGQGPEATTTVDLVRPMTPRPPQPAPARPALPTQPSQPNKTETSAPRPAAPAQQVPMTSAAARFAVEPPPPVIKRRSDLEEQPAPKPAEKRPDQIFTF